MMTTIAIMMMMMMIIIIIIIPFSDLFTILSNIQISARVEFDLTSIFAKLSILAPALNCISLSDIDLLYVITGITLKTYDLCSRNEGSLISARSSMLFQSQHTLHTNRNL
jgi:hypothetical protein